MQARFEAAVQWPALLRLVPSELPLSTHLPTSEGWTAELAAGLWFAESATGFEPTRVYPIRFETLHLIHSATPPRVSLRAGDRGRIKTILKEKHMAPISHAYYLLFFLASATQAGLYLLQLCAVGPCRRGLGALVSG